MMYFADTVLPAPLYTPQRVISQGSPCRPHHDKARHAPLSADDDGLVPLVAYHASVGIFSDGEEVRLEL